MAGHIPRRTFLKGAGVVAGAAAALSGTAGTRALAAGSAPGSADAGLTGQYIQGTGDTSFLRLVDTAYSMYEPNPLLQNISMLYTTTWNGFFEGPTWSYGFWIQNSFGPTYASLPFFQEPYTTFIANSHALWFNMIGNGQRADKRGYVAPDGCLCDFASPTQVAYRQGDGDVAVHDWVYAFTTAGIILQCELLLISRDQAAVAHYLPLLERSAAFVDARRDPVTNHIMVGPAANLLAPSYGAYQLPDGTYGHSALAELSVNYVAALERMIELERFAGRDAMAVTYAQRREAVRGGLPALLTSDGYFLNYIDPDGTKHGVYGAAEHGYFASVVNQDAIAFRVVDDDQAERIYQAMESLTQLRPYGVTIPNYPSLDDVDQGDLDALGPGYTGLWQFGEWVNGGYWSTNEARAVIGYLRLGKYADAVRSMENILGWAEQFRLDAPMTDFGNTPYQPSLPVNTVYDCWGVPGGLLRGLFEYQYTATGLRLRPHIPPTVTSMRQQFPVRFGGKRLYLSTSGTGPVTAAWVNGRLLKPESASSVFLSDGDIPEEAEVVIQLGHGAPPPVTINPPPPPVLQVPPPASSYWDVSSFGSNPTGNGLPLRMGADQNGGTLFTGTMQRIQIYNTVLTSSQVAQLAADPQGPALSEGLVADWDLRTVTNGTVANAAGAGLTATVVGDLQSGTDGLTFAANGYLQVAAAASLVLPDALSFTAYVSPEANIARILDRTPVAHINGYLLDFYPAATPRLLTDYGVVEGAGPVHLGQWVHIAATADSPGALTLYVNGTQVSTAASGAIPAPVGPVVPFGQIGAFYQGMVKAGLDRSYEGQHAALVVKYVQAIHDREALESAGRTYPLPASNQYAADQLYPGTAINLVQGLANVVGGYATSTDRHQQAVYALWQTYCA